MFITYFYDLQLRMKCSNSTTNHTKRSRKALKHSYLFVLLLLLSLSFHHLFSLGEQDLRYEKNEHKLRDCK